MFLFEMRTLTICSLNNYPIYQTVVLAILIMLYITSLVILYVITGRLYFLTTFLQFYFLTPPTSGVITSLISFCILFCLCVSCLFYILCICEIMHHLSFSDLFHQHLSTNGHLGQSHVLAMNMSCRYLFELVFNIFPKIELLNHMVVYF